METLKRFSQALKQQYSAVVNLHVPRETPHVTALIAGGKPVFQSQETEAEKCDAERISLIFRLWCDDERLIKSSY